METKTPQMLKPSTLKSILKKKNKYSKPSVFRKFMPKATQKSSRKQKVNFSGDERRWTYDNYWIIRKRIILGICFKHISKGYLQYRSVQVEISKKINDFNKLVKSHPPVKNHFEEEDKIFFDVLNKVVSMANYKYNEKKKIMKEIEELKHPKFNLTTEEDDNDKARLDDLKNELVVINENESKLKKKRKQLWGEEDLLNEIIKDESGKPNDLNARIRPKKKKTMSEWVRFPPKGELNKVEKELMQSILKDGSEGHGLVDLKKKYFHDPKVPNDSDILKDFDLDIDAFLKENEASQEGESTSATPPPREEGISSKEFEDGMDALVGLGGRRTIRKRRTRRKVRKKGTKKKARRRRTKKKARRRTKKKTRRRRTRNNYFSTI